MRTIMRREVPGGRDFGYRGGEVDRPATEGLLDDRHGNRRVVDHGLGDVADEHAGQPRSIAAVTPYDDVVDLVLRRVFDDDLAGVTLIVGRLVRSRSRAWRSTSAIVRWAMRSLTCWTLPVRPPSIA